MTRGKTLRKGLIGSLLLVSMATAVGAYGTFAFFTDTETVASNVFTSGTLDLSVDTGGSTDAFFGHDNFAPGDVVDGTVTLANVGTITSFDGDGHTVNLAITVGITQVDAEGGTTDLADYIQVTTLDYDGADLLVGLSDTNGNGFVDMGDLAASGVSGLSDPGAAGKVLSLQVKFHETGHNGLQGDSLTAGFGFTLEQS